MKLFRKRVPAVAGLLLLGAALLCAQDWKTVDALPAVDFTGLTPAQKTAVLKVLREHDCSCGCAMKVAECRVLDPNCSFSKGLAAAVVDSVRQGKSPADAWTAAAASRWAKGPQQDTRVLGDPVSIPIAGAPVRGPANAPITLVEFSDFQCPYCAEAVAQLRAVMAAYPTQVKLVFKQFPLDIHSQAALAAAAAIAAQHQGKFWELHDAMFADRTNLSRPRILAMAGKIGLDLKRFEADWSSPFVEQAVRRDEQDGENAGVEGTPTLFVDGRRFNGVIRLEVLKPLLDAELKQPARK